ncbi:hypothetical protein NDU88_003074 [Pleurodeles waltl]|uniref:Uncharacterized protein n=1 Tax=Pleurodeles waltl TaxID=8319 RepID=A0AAV7WNC2_PLEWA|nr:hypothetical protein NDU88_003074 [Pleurodeles waltl]
MITPTYEDPNPEMLKEWAMHNAQTSAGMMTILIKYAKIDRGKIIENIEIVTTKIDSCEDKKLVESLSKAMDDRLRKLEKDIIHKKARKFNRDKIDYETGQIDIFAKKFDHWRKQKLSEINTTDLNQTTCGTNTEVSESSDMDGDESTRMKLHTTLQEEFDFLRTDPKSSHRPW